MLKFVLFLLFVMAPGEPLPKLYLVQTKNQGNIQGPQVSPGKVHRKMESFADTADSFENEEGEDYADDEDNEAVPDQVVPGLDTLEMKLDGDYTALDKKDKKDSVESEEDEEGEDYADDEDNKAVSDQVVPGLDTLEMKLDGDYKALDKKDKNKKGDDDEDNTGNDYAGILEENTSLSEEDDDDVSESLGEEEEYGSEYLGGLVDVDETKSEVVVTQTDDNEWPARF